MPTLSHDQIREIELDIQALAEENRELREENTALKATVLRQDQELKTD